MLISYNVTPKFWITKIDTRNICHVTSCVLQLSTSLELHYSLDNALAHYPRFAKRSLTRYNCFVRSLDRMRKTSRNSSRRSAALGCDGKSSRERQSAAHAAPLNKKLPQLVRSVRSANRSIDRSEAEFACCIWLC